MLRTTPQFRELIVYTLQNTGFDVRGFSDGRAFFAALDEKRPKLVLLDVMLPDQDGLAILRKLRAGAVTKDIPVILVTAKGTEYDKVIGLDSGADDYIAKPFGMMELVSRVKAVLRRTSAAASAGTLTAGRITMNADKHIVTAEGNEISLTLKEFELLRSLLENKGIVMNRERLLESIWGYDFDGETRTVDVHIRTLRQKLGDGGDVIENHSRRRLSDRRVTG